MFDGVTGDARIVVVHAQQHARRLGYGAIGGEHLLLAVVATDTPAGAVLREHGLTPRAEEAIVSRLGLGGAAALFADLDRDALASIGIDLDAVRARVEASLSMETRARAGRAVPGRSGPRCRHRSGGPLRGWRRRTHRGPAVPAAALATPPAATGRFRVRGAPPTGHLPLTPDAKRILHRALRETPTRHHPVIDVEHLALSLLTAGDGPVTALMGALDCPAPPLRAAILDRYRQAG